MKIDSLKINYFLIFNSVMKNKLKNKLGKDYTWPFAYYLVAGNCMASKPFYT